MAPRTEKTPEVTAEVTPKVVISEAPAAEAPKLSAQTIAEQEAGRVALKARQDAMKANQAS